jgi:hypothetical protein
MFRPDKLNNTQPGIYPGIGRPDSEGWYTSVVEQPWQPKAVPRQNRTCRAVALPPPSI